METFEAFNNNINENINITSSLKGVKEYRNGLTPETVMKEFPWLLKAKFKYAVSVSFDLLIDKLKELGYSVFIKNSGGKKVIMWSTKTHWASASFLDSSEDDLKRVCQRLKETIYNVSFSNAR